MNSTIPSCRPPRHAAAPPRPSRRPVRGTVAALAALAAAGCAAGDPPLDRTAPAPVTESPAAVATPGTDGRPGAGVEVTMARGNWATGYLQAAIFRALLTELGYTVTDPADAELPPTDFYPALAEGTYDFWANGWFPNHAEYIQAEDPEADLPEGTVVADHVSRIGTQMAHGGLQGFLVDKKTADELGIVSMADIAANPAPWDSDGDGLAEVAGCDEGWLCQVIIDEIIAVNGWEDTVEQVSGAYDDLWATQIARLERNEPVLAYTWTPSAYIVQLVPGRNAYWLSVPRTVVGQDAAAALPESQCPSQPCTMGFRPADVSVVANNEFLAANPAAAELFERVTIDVVDVALQNVRYRGGENSAADIAAHAAAWIVDNRDRVDVWLAAARAAR